MGAVRNNLNAGSALEDPATTWTYTLSFTPTAGRCLLMYIQCNSTLSITSITQGGSSAAWTLITSSAVANNNIYVYALTDTPSGSNTTVTMVLGSANNFFSTIIEEVTGLVAVAANLLDKSSTSSGTGNTYQTGTTAATVTNDEYWVNIYSWYDSSLFAEPVGASPTNSYSLATPNPVTINTGGWTGAGGLPFLAFGAGQIMAYRIVTTTGTAGGNVTDGNAGGLPYNGLAIALNATASVPGSINTRRRMVMPAVMM